MTIADNNYNNKFEYDMYYNIITDQLATHTSGSLCVKTMSQDAWMLKEIGEALITEKKIESYEVSPTYEGEDYFFMGYEVWLYL